MKKSAMRSRSRYSGVLILVLAAMATASRAQVPEMIGYQGRVVLGGTNYDGTATFKFALGDRGFAQTYWVNDATGPGEPSDGVSLTVNKGLFSVRLGDTNLAHMIPLPSSVFTNADLWLRVWFDDGSGSLRLVPDQQLVSAAYAMRADGVGVGAITVEMLSDGAVASNKIQWAQMPAGLQDGDSDTTYAAGAGLSLAGITFSIADSGVTGGKLAADAVSSNKIHWAQMPPGLQDGDNDTTYAAGAGLSLAGTTFSVADGGVTADKLAAGAVTADKIGAGAVTGEKIGGPPVILSSLNVTNPAPDADDAFAQAAAAVGTDRLALGAPSADEGATDAGCVYVYDADGQLMSSITNPAPETNDQFGWSVSAVGSSCLVVGAPNDRVGADRVGQANLFDLSGACLLTLTNPSAQFNSKFGQAVAGAGDAKFLVGAPEYDAPGGQSDAGCAYLFSTSGVLLATIANPSPQTSDAFGFALVTAGADRLAIGAPGDRGGGSRVGAVHVYDGNGSYVGEITNPAPVLDARFGCALAALGTNRFVVGAESAVCSGGITAGVVYVYTTGGSLLQAIENPEPETGDQFGHSVAALGTDMLLVGADGDDTDGVDSGRAYLYRADGTLLVTLANPAPTWNDRFAACVAAIGETRLTVGVPQDDPGASAAGSAWLFSAGKLLEGAVAQVADGSVTQTKLADGAVAESKLADGAVTADKIASGSVSNTHLTANSVNSGRIMDGSIAGVDLGANCITSDKIADGSVSNADLAANAVTSDKILDGTITADDVAGNTFWRTDGNVGTTAGTQFLGTTDYQSLEIKVNGERVMRFEPHTKPSPPYACTSAPNVIAGAPINAVDALAVGATIAGGGAVFYVNWSLTNRVDGHFGTVGGGGGNEVLASFGTIPGGRENTIYSTGNSSVIAGGFLNSSDGSSGSIGGGSGNAIEHLAVCGTIGGGHENVVVQSSEYGTIGGGGGNVIGNSSEYGTIGGGANNMAGGYYPTIGGGECNAASGWSFVGGGWSNLIEGLQGTIGGGARNRISGYQTGATIGGGEWNSIGAYAYRATVGGGFTNTVGSYADCAAIGGGADNHIGDSSDYGAVIGGFGNAVGTNALASTIAGGYRCAVADNAGYAFAAGRRAKANHPGAFVWADSQNADFASTSSNQFLIRAQGGAGIGRAPTANALEVEGTASKTTAGDWLANSDARIKADVRPIERALDTIDSLQPVSFQYTDEYRRHHPSIEDRRYCNFVAQEFREVFPESVKDDGTGLLQVDTYNVRPYLVAAVQELHQIVKEKDARIGELEARLSALEEKLGDR